MKIVVTMDNNNEQYRIEKRAINKVETQISHNSATGLSAVVFCYDSGYIITYENNFYKVLAQTKAFVPSNKSTTN